MASIRAKFIYFCTVFSPPNNLNNSKNNVIGAVFHEMDFDGRDMYGVMIIWLFDYYLRRLSIYIYNLILTIGGGLKFEDFMVSSFVWFKYQFSIPIREILELIYGKFRFILCVSRRKFPDHLYNSFPFFENENFSRIFLELQDTTSCCKTLLWRENSIYILIF